MVSGLNHPFSSTLQLNPWEVLSNITAFAVVTDLYRTEAFPSFNHARPGELRCSVLRDVN